MNFLKNLLDCVRGILQRMLYPWDFEVAVVYERRIVNLILVSK